MLLVLSGCAHVEHQAHDPGATDVPAAWSVVNTGASREAASMVGWWLRFDDPLLTLLLGEALQTNTTVTGAQAALRQARALR